MWSLSLHLLLTVVVGIAGWQDWKTRGVSNFITIPLFAAGLVAISWRAFLSEAEGAIVGFSLFVVGILTIAAFQGWMGGADWKVLVGLWGTWPAAGLIALMSAGIWGMLKMVLTKQQREPFAGISIYALATAFLLVFNAASSPG